MKEIMPRDMTAILYTSKDIGRRKGSMFAYSLDCNFGAFGNNPQDATNNLARALANHIWSSAEEGINPFVGNEKGYARLGKYFANNSEMPLEFSAKTDTIALHAYDLRNRRSALINSL